MSWPGWSGQNKTCHCCQEHPDPRPHALWMATQFLVLAPQNQHLCPHPKYTPGVPPRHAGDSDLAKALFG